MYMVYPSQWKLGSPLFLWTTNLRCVLMIAWFKFTEDNGNLGGSEMDHQMGHLMLSYILIRTILLYIIHRHIYIYIYVRVFLQISASLHDNAKLARVGVARAAPAHGLTELFLIKYFALLYVRSNITLHDPFLQIIIWTT